MLVMLSNVQVVSELQFYSLCVICPIMVTVIFSFVFYCLPFPGSRGWYTFLSFMILSILHEYIDFSHFTKCRLFLPLQDDYFRTWSPGKPFDQGKILLLVICVV